MQLTHTDDLFSASTPPSEVPALPAQKAGGDEWLTTFAMLTLSGVGVEMAAERLKKPRVVLEQMLQQPMFKGLLQQLAAETGKDAAVTLIRSAAVDSVLKLIKLRDSAQSEKLQFESAKLLTMMNFFPSGKKELPKDAEGVADAIRKSGGHVEAGIDAELERLVKNSPNLRNHPLLAPLVLSAAEGATQADRRGAELPG
jgi:hypothetical protein